ncbi:MAG TPA: methionyl-tRNA formyltransferase [Usitatibacter sp.]|nr:methionyl-tRNA formyltransferase [Usitatibacter sp.]
MRVVFAGTPPFAARALEAILAAGHEVVLVLTQPDRPAGRGMHATQSAVAQLASSNAIPVEKPATLRDSAAHAGLIAARADVLVVAAYGLLLPAAVLRIPKYGCLNIHASLLPRWRGAAPIQRAILAGDRETGVCIMRMAEGLDTGPVLLESRIDIASRETMGELTDRLAALGADAITQALARIGDLEERIQDDSRATYAQKVLKAESRVDWRLSSLEIERAIRAFNPSPGAETRLDDLVLKIWRVDLAEGSGKPGEVLESERGRLIVATGSGALELQEIQKSGGKRLSAAEFLRGSRVAKGGVFTPI